MGKGREREKEDEKWRMGESKLELNIFEDKGLRGRWHGVYETAGNERGRDEQRSTD